MIRVVFDTNIVISGSLWSGVPHLALQAAFEGKVKPLISEALVDELKDVIERPKFAKRLTLIGKTTAQIIDDYLKVAEIIETEAIAPTIIVDPDDDQVLACALNGEAVCIVSGDPHLLDVKSFHNIPVMTANDFLTFMASEAEQSEDTDEL